jgi:hypothetical protein
MKKFTELNEGLMDMILDQNKKAIYKMAGIELKKYTITTDEPIKVEIKDVHEYEQFVRQLRKNDIRYKIDEEDIEID